MAGKKGLKVLGVIAALGMTAAGISTCAAWKVNTYKLPEATDAIVLNYSGRLVAVVHNLPIGTPKEEVQTELEMLRARYRAQGYVAKRDENADPNAPFYGYEIRVETGAGLHFKGARDSVKTIDNRARFWTTTPNKLTLADGSSMNLQGLTVLTLEDPKIFFEKNGGSWETAMNVVYDLGDNAFKRVVGRYASDDMIRTMKLGGGPERVFSFSEPDIAQYGFDQALVTNLQRSHYQFPVLTNGQEAVNTALLAEYNTIFNQYGIKTEGDLSFLIRAGYDPSVNGTIIKNMVADLSIVSSYLTQLGLSEEKMILGRQNMDEKIISSYGTAVMAQMRGIGEAEELHAPASVYKLAPTLFTFLESLDKLKEMPAGKYTVMVDAQETPIFALLNGSLGLNPELLAKLKKELSSLSMEQLEAIKTQLAPIDSLTDIGYIVPSLDQFMVNFGNPTSMNEAPNPNVYK